jgi:hypothetical protein
VPPHTSRHIEAHKAQDVGTSNAHQAPHKKTPRKAHQKPSLPWNSPPVATRGLLTPFGQSLPWGGGPCFVLLFFYFHDYASRGGGGGTRKTQKIQVLNQHGRGRNGLLEAGGVPADWRQHLGLVLPNLQQAGPWSAASSGYRRAGQPQELHTGAAAGAAHRPGPRAPGAHLVSWCSTPPHRRS